VLPFDRKSPFELDSATPLLHKYMRLSDPEVEGAVSPCDMMSHWIRSGITDSRCGCMGIGRESEKAWRLMRAVWAAVCIYDMSQIISEPEIGNNDEPGKYPQRIANAYSSPVSYALSEAHGASG
jgi:hypothetical protein